MKVLITMSLIISVYNECDEDLNAFVYSYVHMMHQGHITIQFINIYSFKCTVSEVSLDTSLLNASDL